MAARVLDVPLCHPSPGCAGDEPRAQAVPGEVSRVAADDLDRGFDRPCHVDWREPSQPTSAYREKIVI